MNAMNSSKIVEVFDESMPAQYFLGVHDFDEKRGVAIFGNAFGELALFDFSDACCNDMRSLETYFEQLHFPRVPQFDIPHLGIWLGLRTRILLLRATNPSSTMRLLCHLQSGRNPFCLWSRGCDCVRRSRFYLTSRSCRDDQPSGNRGIASYSGAHVRPDEGR